MLYERQLPAVDGGAVIGKNGQIGAWLGPDAISLRTVTIKPGKSGIVPVDIRHLAPLVPAIELSTLTISSRSRYAQLGGGITPDAAGKLIHALSQSNPPERISLTAANHSKAPLRITRGEVCRLISRHGPDLTGDELLEMIDRDKIVLAGEQDNQWWVHKARSGRPIGVGMKLKPIEEWIPPQDMPVNTNGATNGTFRAELAAALKPIKPGDKPEIRIGETAVELGLSEDMFGFIDPVVDTSTAPTNVRVANKQHPYAPALYPDHHWYIRTETLSTQEELLAPLDSLARKAIVVTFARVEPVISQQ